MRACSFPARIPFFRLCCAVCVAIAVLSADAKKHHDEERPEWIAQPKSSDLMYLYVVGHAAGQPSETEAQDAAYRNALQKIAAQIPAPDGKPVPPARIQRAEVVPGCRYVEEAGSGYEAWVQVSYPAAEKKKLQEQADQGKIPGGTTQADAGETIGPQGGELENRELGVTVNIPQGAVKTATPITIRRAENPPPLGGGPMPSALTSLLYPGPVLDLGPSATRFDQPVNVRLKWPELAGLDPKQFEPEVGWYDGATWQPLETVEFKDGEISFNTDHFSWFLPVAVGGFILTAVAWYEMQEWMDVWKTPEILITPDKIPQTHLDKITLPEKLEFPLNLPQRGFNTFKGVNRPAVFPANGATMVTRKNANCWDCCNYVASVLLAKNDPRFKLFKIVQGKVTVTNREGQRETGDHAWIEIKIDNQVYVLDTTHPNNLVLIPKDEAYRRDKLEPTTQWSHRPGSKKAYTDWNVSSTTSTSSATSTTSTSATSSTSDTATSTKWKFSGVSPDNWEVSYNEKGLVMQRKPAKNKGKSGESSVTASLYAEFPTAASGKDAPKTAGDCLAAAEKSFKSRRQGKTPNDPAVGLEMVGGVEGAKSFAIGDFLGAMADYALWMRRGSWSDAGYTGSYFGSNGDGSAVKENMIIRFGYSVSGGGCWDNSDRAYLVSQGTAAQKEARAILASLRAGPDGEIKQEPYKGPKYDGSDIPK